MCSCVYTIVHNYLRKMIKQAVEKLLWIFQYICILKVVTITETTQNISEIISNNEEFRPVQMGMLVRDQNHSSDPPISSLNLTRKNRKNLIKQLREAKEMIECISLAKEQYAECSGFKHQLQKTAELLDTYQREVNKTYEVIYNVIHGLTAEFSRADLVATLQGINETLKKQVRDELEKFTPIRDTDF